MVTWIRACVAVGMGFELLSKKRKKKKMKVKLEPYLKDSQKFLKFTLVSELATETLRS